MNWALLNAFVASCAAFDVEPPAAAIRGLQLVDVAEAHKSEPDAPMLALTDDEMRERVTAIAVRRHTGVNDYITGLASGVEVVTAALAVEVRKACLPDLDRIIDELRPQFDSLAAPIVNAAQRHGFTLRTTSDEVILRADESASAAWRDLRSAWHTVRPLAELRQQMSTIFDVSPVGVLNQWKPVGSPVDYSVCFAAGDNWSTDGTRYVEGNVLSDINWLDLATGGLRLNGPTETREKLAARR